MPIRWRGVAHSWLGTNPRRRWTGGQFALPRAPLIDLAAHPTPSPTAANLIGQSNINAVSEPSAGIYCITPAAGITVSGIATGGYFGFVIVGLVIVQILTISLCVMPFRSWIANGNSRPDFAPGAR